MAYERCGPDNVEVLSFDPPPGRGGPQNIPRPVDARPGGPAPWAEIGAELASGLTLDHMAAVVGDPPPDAPPAVIVDGRAPSAVLAPVFDAGNGPELLLTRRAWHLRSHTGEVSFPGGRAEPQDVDLVATALRETHEEVGIAPEAVRIEGELTRLTTVSSPAFIVPYLGVLDGRPNMVIDEGEVDAVLCVPIAELLDPAIYRQEIWARDGASMEITFFELQNDTLWGATARMVRDLLERLMMGAGLGDPSSQGPSVS